MERIATDPDALNFERLVRAGRADAERWQQESPSSSSDIDGELSRSRTVSEIPPLELPGYLLLNEACRGGQAVVYEATHLATRRHVAIKLFRKEVGLPGSEQRRFEREAELLTQLRHPNIVTVHDAGSTSAGFYIVMDFVAGRPLDEFIAARVADRRIDGRAASIAADSVAPPWALRDTLRLFAKICDAVNAAHLRGVIHRDLKPANILVGADGTPHVVDFGLARLAADSGNDQTITEAGQFLGSLRWASPEQAAGDHVRIDIRTDVYSLGVILYNILTGRFPYDVTGSMRDVLNRIVQSEPIEPRTALRSVIDPSIPRSPYLVDSELEAIVLKCLSKDPAGRYQSAGDLARDIRHYLAGEAIEAKCQSRWYVLRKALRRHRFPVAIAAAFLFLIFSGIVVSTVFWQRAENQAAQSQAIAAFMEQTLDGVNPWRSSGLDTKLLQKMMDEAAGRIRAGELQDVPEAELRLRVSIGNVYAQITEYAAAHEMLDGVEEMARRIHGAEHPQMARTLRACATLHYFESDFTGALARFEAAKGICQRVGPIDVESLVFQYCGIVDCLTELCRFNDALTEANACFDVAQRLLPAGHACVLTSSLKLASSLQHVGRFREATDQYEALLAALEKRPAGDDLFAASTRLHFAGCLLDFDRPADAMPVFQEALAIMQKVYGRDHPDIVRTLNCIGFCLIGLDRLDEAIVSHTAALEMARRIYASPDIQVAGAMGYLAEGLRRAGRYGEAETRAREAVEMYRANRQWDPTAAMDNEWYLARILSETGRSGEAVAGLRELLSMVARDFPDRADARVCGFCMLIYVLLTQNGEAGYRDAEKAAREARAVCDVEVPRDGVRAWVRDFVNGLLGAALSRQGRFVEAEPLLLEAYRGLREKRSGPSPGQIGVDFKKAVLEYMVDMYEAWDKAEPGLHERDLSRWRAELETPPSTSRPTVRVPDAAERAPPESSP